MSDHAIQNGKAHLGGIVAAHWAHDWLLSNNRSGNDLNNEARALLREFDWPAADADDVAELIEERMREEPLSFLVRSEWYNPHGNGRDSDPAEFELLLSTGGPALRLIGEIARCNGATRCRLQWQDWGTAWTDLETTAAEDDALEWFAELFTLSLD